jgi:hypothetical protein
MPYTHPNDYNLENLHKSMEYNPNGQPAIRTDSYTAMNSAAHDPVNKYRVSTPQSLIDTDFEYGLQPTKWEQLALANNRPTAFYDPTAPFTVTNITGVGTRTVTVASTSLPALGSIVLIQDSLDYNANGWFYVDSINPGVSFTYIADAVVGAGTKFDPTRTYVFGGNLYSQTGIPVSTSSGAAFTTGSTTVTCTTTGAHGLYPGNLIYVFGTTAGGNPPNGAWIVVTTPTANTFTFVVATAPSGAITASAGIRQTLFARPNGIVAHRPYDGGVSFSAGSLSPGATFIRQTRRYFRYQSGKGIQFSTGTSLKPALAVSQLTSSGTTVTVTCNTAHQLSVGTIILVENASPAAYNGTFAIVSTPAENVLTYTALTAPVTTPALGFPIRVSPFSWYGSSNRVGMFDQQNGLFFEFDGQKMYTVRRNSVTQLAGTVAVTSGSQFVTGTNSQFADQLDIGDYIVIRGSSYKVLSITSQTNMLITPEYKGVTLARGVIVSKTVDTRVAQENWTDPCNGTGNSGYNLNLSRMQMIYMDYSWYGAGTARFGFRGTDGGVIYVNSFVNNNLQYEAYMRSGNLPAHYESSAELPRTKLLATISSGATTGDTISVADTSRFPSSGTVRVTNPGTAGAVEFISYSAKTSNTLTILARAQTGGSAVAETFTFSATAPIAVELSAPAAAAAISHWGSAIIMDGRFDDDKSLIFNAGMTTSISVSQNATQPIISLRLAPSVDSGFTGILGAREIINRMQLKLDSMGLLANGPFLIQARLNGIASGGIFASAGGSSLAQVAIHTSGQTITGGENAAAFYADSSGTNQVLTTLDLTQVRDLGTSILGGGTNNNVPTSSANLYPDGPDVITITVTNIGTSTHTVLARLSWTEAQA